MKSNRNVIIVWSYFRNRFSLEHISRFALGSTLTINLRMCWWTAILFSLSRIYRGVTEERRKNTFFVAACPIAKVGWINRVLCCGYWRREFLASNDLSIFAILKISHLNSFNLSSSSFIPPFKFKPLFCYQIREIFGSNWCGKLSKVSRSEASKVDCKWQNSMPKKTVIKTRSDQITQKTKS